MRNKPVFRRRAAENDIQDILDYYCREDSPETASRFWDALELAIGLISRQPAAGSPRYAQELNLPGLRYRLVPRFPYLIFYTATSDGVDIWRVFHAQRDIPASMSDTNS
ncbi:MAG: type II toxin-antitoxin system RelE/ParE family toxin [Burkholderiales bacterium]|nr:type II toxin-antitoxin system RelE/ParE family toxin [Burkholderiales bacterium]